MTRPLHQFTSATLPADSGARLPQTASAAPFRPMDPDMLARIHEGQPVEDGEPLTPLENGLIWTTIIVGNATLFGGLLFWWLA